MPVCANTPSRFLGCDVGKAAIVVPGSDGLPTVKLGNGERTVTGDFSWDTLPEALLVPPAILAPPEWGLTRREARVYAHLASRDVATREGVMYVIGDGRALEAQNLTVTVYSIRKKLPDNMRIETVWGIGYRLVRL